MSNDRGMINMSAGAGKGFSLAYSAWFGKSVVLLLTIHHCQVPLACSIVDESVDGVRVQTEAGWELEIRKEFILAVEEYPGAMKQQVN
jgi:hypothetical protein